jgi:hypothetical protein
MHEDSALENSPPAGIKYWNGCGEFGGCDLQLISKIISSYPLLSVGLIYFRPRREKSLGPGIKLVQNRKGGFAVAIVQ